jgi:hypothetical protein
MVVVTEAQEALTEVVELVVIQVMAVLVVTPQVLVAPQEVEEVAEAELLITYPMVVAEVVAV